MTSADIIIEAMSIDAQSDAEKQLAELVIQLSNHIAELKERIDGLERRERLEQR